MEPKVEKGWIISLFVFVVVMVVINIFSPNPGDERSISKNAMQSVEYCEGKQPTIYEQKIAEIPVKTECLLLIYDENQLIGVRDDQGKISAVFPAGK